MSQDNDKAQQSSNSTGWFVGIIVALALLAIGYLVFSANSGPAKVSSVAPQHAVQGEVLAG